MDKKMAKTLEDFGDQDSLLSDSVLKLPGLHGDHLCFYVNEGHFYYNDFKQCADIEFLELCDESRKIYCQAEPGSLHDHPVPTLESVDIAVVRWACRLRVLQHFSEETILQSIDLITSSWPHKLPLSVYTIKLMFNEALQQYQHMAKENDPFVQVFLNNYGDEELKHFQKAITQPRPYWTVQDVSQGSACPEVPTKEDSGKKILNELEKVIKMAINIHSRAKGSKKFNFRQSLLLFNDAILGYKKLFKKKLERSNIPDKEKLVNSAENHPLFKPSRLEQWLSFKEAELNIVNKILSLAKSSGISVITTKDELLSELLDSDYKYVFVLCISRFDELTEIIFQMMKDFEKEEEKVLENLDDYENVPWHVVENRENCVLKEIKKMAIFIAKQNRNVKDQVSYSVMLTEESYQLGCWYSVYEDGVIEKTYISELPKPPSDLRISFVSDEVLGPVICLEWRHNDLGYPGEFLVQYRLTGVSQLWEKIKTKQTLVTFSYEQGTLMEFRVATCSCIGRSEFTEIINTQFLVDSNDRQVRQRRENNFRTESRKRRNNSRDVCIEPDQLTQLSTSPGKKKKLQHSTLTEHRFPESLVNQCHKIGSSNRIDHYLVPLTKLTGESEDNLAVERFVFGQTNDAKDRKTILLVGITGSKKTDFINAMINYIFNVDLTDRFRFDLIPEQATCQSPSVTSQARRSTIYEINHHEGFRIPFSLVIIDTSGFNKTFFRDCTSICEIDLIGIVAQSTLSRLTPAHLDGFQSLFSILGKDLKENIRFLLTLSDYPVSATLNAIANTDLPFSKDPETGEPLHCSFNSCGFFRHSFRDFKGDAIGQKNFEDFFSTLSTVKTKSLSLTLEVVNEREQLETAKAKLDSIVNFNLNTMDEIDITQKIISIRQSMINENLIEAAQETEIVPPLVAKSTAERRVAALKNMMAVNNIAEVKQREFVAQCSRRLEEISLHPNPVFSFRRHSF